MAKDIFLKVQEINRSLKMLPGIYNPSNHSVRFDSLITDSELKKVTSGLYSDGYYARAVEEAFKFVNNLIKKKAGLDTSIDGANLMKRVLSASASEPIIKINAGLSKSDKDEQLGYMEIYAGCITGIRNPRAHEHELEDSSHNALQLIIWADHLVEKIRNAHCSTISD